MKIGPILVSILFSSVVRVEGQGSSYNPWGVHVDFSARKGDELIAAANDLRVQAGRLLGQKILAERYHSNARIVWADPESAPDRRTLRDDFRMSGSYGEVLVELLAQNSCVGDFTEAADGDSYRFTVSPKDKALSCVLFLAIPASWVEGVQKAGVDEFFAAKGLVPSNAREAKISRDGHYLLWRDSPANCDKLRLLMGKQAEHEKKTGDSQKHLTSP